jgi:hypothetical protein
VRNRWGTPFVVGRALHAPVRVEPLQGAAIIDGLNGADGNPDTEVELAHVRTSVAATLGPSPLAYQTNVCLAVR